MDVSKFSRLLNADSSGDVLKFQDEFTRLLVTFDPRTAVAEQLRKCLNDHRDPPPIVFESTLQLVSGGWFSIDLSVNHNTLPSPVVHTHADALSKFLSPVHYDRYRLCNFDKSFFTTDASIELMARGTVKSGDIITIDSNRDVYRFHSDGPLICVSLTNKFYNGTTWRFDVSTGRPISHFNSSPATTVLEMIARFLGLYGEDASIAPLQSLLSHSSESIRWEAACALAHLSSVEGQIAFQTLAASDSPSLATAARRTLSSSCISQRT